MMASRIAHLLLCAGGVVLPALWKAAVESFCPGWRPDLRSQAELAVLEQGLAAGHLTASQFRSAVLRLSGAPPAGPAALAAPLARVEPAAGMPGLLEELAPVVRLTLLSDYPRDWLPAILARTGLARFFAEDAVRYAADHGGCDGLREALAAGGLTPGRSLWVDHHPLRTSAAIRRGIDAAIFVDARRLRRDLTLWGVLSD